MTTHFTVASFGGSKKCYSWIYHRLVHKKYPVCLSWVPYFSSSYHAFMLKTHPFTTEHIWKQHEYKNEFWLFPSRVTCSLEAGLADCGRTWTSPHGTYTVPASRCICPPPFWINGASATWLTALATTGNTEAVSRNSRSCVFYLILMTEIQTIKVRNYVILQWKMDFFTPPPRDNLLIAVSSAKEQGERATEESLQHARETRSESHGVLRQ